MRYVYPVEWFELCNVHHISPGGSIFHWGQTPSPPTFPIAHTAVLLVALTANRIGCDDKIRFVKSFVPKFLTL